MVWSFKGKKGNQVEPEKEPEEKDNKLDNDNVSMRLSQDHDKKLSILEQDAEPGGRQKRRCKCKNWPCCFYMPLEIAMELFALIDIIYNFFCVIFMAVLLTFEPFIGKNQPTMKNKTLGLEYLSELDNMLAQTSNDFYNSKRDPSEQEYASMFSEMTTTIGPIEFEEDEFDVEKAARNYSRVAAYYSENGHEIDVGCGRDYFLHYLFSQQLTVTRILFEETIDTVMLAHGLFFLFGMLLLVCLCCFRGYILTKIIIIALWALQLLPCFYLICAAVMSQSHRFCILEHGIVWIKGQRAFLVWTIVHIVPYKVYELFIWSNLVKKLFATKDGGLTDESYFSAEKTIEREYKHLAMLIPSKSTTDLNKHHYHHYLGNKKLFRHFHWHEHHKGGTTVQNLAWILRSAKEGGKTGNMKQNESSSSSSSDSN